MSQFLPTSPSAPLSHPPVATGAALRWWMLLLVALLAFGVYANTLNNQFAYDDMAIVRGPHVTNLEWTAIWYDNYWPLMQGTHPDTLYRPLAVWTYLANQAILPDIAWPFHLVNIVLNSLVAVLVSVLAWRIIQDRVVAVLAGALFAVHPIHTEAVANTVGRAEILAALWSILALLIFLPSQSINGDHHQIRRPWWHGILVSICFLAALLCKETPVTLLLAIPFIDLWRWARWTPMTRPSLWRWLATQSMRYYAPLAAAFGLYLALRIPACGLMADVKVTHPMVNALVNASIPERIVTPFMLLAKYLWITFWPVHLASDYSSPSLLPTANPFYANSFQPPAAAGMMVVILAIIFTARTWRKKPQITLLMGLGVTSYLLIANFLRIGTIMGERLFYWPSVFVLILAAWGMVAIYRTLNQAFSNLQGRQFVLKIACIFLFTTILSLMSWRTVVRNTDWKDNITLAISAARDNPNSGKSCTWAGAVLRMADRPDFVEFGKALLERAITLSPKYGDAYWHLALHYGTLHEMAPSAIFLSKKARLEPGDQMTRNSLPALVEEMRTIPPEKFIPLLEANIAEHPDDETAYLAMALGYHSQNQYEDAANYARKAIDIAHGKEKRKDGYDQFHEAAAELASIWYESGQKKEGIDKFRVYATYMYHSVGAHCDFAAMLMTLDPVEFPTARNEALANLNLAKNLDPDNPRIRDLNGKLSRLQKGLVDLPMSTAQAHESKLDSPADIGDVP